MVRRSLLLRVLLSTRILVSSTTKRCLHGLEGFLSQMSLRRLLVSQMSLRGALLTQDLVCGELGNAAVSCEVVLFTQHLPARIVVNADLSCEAPSYTRGARGSEGAHFYTRGARGSDSRGHEALKPVGKRDTMTHRSVRTEVLIFFGLGIRLLL